MADDITRLVDTQPVGAGILAAGAIAGGVVLGSAMMLSFREGWIQEPEIPEEQSTGQELLQFGVAYGAVILGGEMLCDVIKDMGRTKFLWTIGGFTALVAAARGVMALSGK
jgi:hypothetical protein